MKAQTPPRTAHSASNTDGDGISWLLLAIDGVACDALEESREHQPMERRDARTSRRVPEAHGVDSGPSAPAGCRRGPARWTSRATPLRGDASPRGARAADRLRCPRRARSRPALPGSGARVTASSPEPGAADELVEQASQLPEHLARVPPLVAADAADGLPGGVGIHRDVDGAHVGRPPCRPPFRGRSPLPATPARTCRRTWWGPCPRGVADGEVDGLGHGSRSNGNSCSADGR